MEPRPLRYLLKRRDCPDCDGKGVLPNGSCSAALDANGAYVIEDQPATVCATCNGAGRVYVIPACRRPRFSVEK